MAAPDAVSWRRKLLRKLSSGRFWAQNASGVAGAVLVLAVLFCAAFAPLLTPYDPNAQDLSSALRPGIWSPAGDISHPLGTDPLGRDLLCRLIFGSRVSLAVGAFSVLVAGSLGVLLGLVAGYFGGWWDTVIMRLADLELALPFILLAMAVMALLGPGLANEILVLGITGWVVYGRIVRGQTLSVREKEYVEAARAIGTSNTRIILRHVLPNVASPVIVVATLQVPSMILSDAALSFLGLGVPPSVTTWGQMISDGRAYVDTAWWVATFPGVAILLTVMGINLLGDWLRDALDPQYRGR